MVAIGKTLKEQINFHKKIQERGRWLIQTPKRFHASIFNTGQLKKIHFIFNVYFLSGNKHK